jgi:transcription elongation factor Elf1
MMAELLPCPFCGGEAYTYTATNTEKGITRKYWLVHCKKCGINYPYKE